MKKRIIIHFSGLLLLAIGIRIMIIAGLGVFPMDGLVGYMADYIFGGINFNVALGLSSFIINTVVMLICMAIKKDWKVVYSLINTIVFTFLLAGAGAIMDLLNINIPEGYLWANWIVAFVGFFVIAVGIDFTVYTKLIAAPIEYAMLLFDKLFKNLTLSKLAIEICIFIATMSFALIVWNFEYIGWFTAIAVITISPLLQLLYKPITKIFGEVKTENVSQEEITDNQ